MARKILFVDDEAPIRRAFEIGASKAGYEVRCAASAEEALEALASEVFHVIFTDLNMPTMNGVDLCREIRRDHPMPVVYAMTGYASLYDMADCRDAGFDDVFQKPIGIDRLLKAVEDGFEKVDRWLR